MKNGKWLFVVSLFALTAAGLAAQETWTKVTGADEITGRWEGSKTMEIPKNELMPQSSLKVIFHLNRERGKNQVTIVMDMDFTRFLNDWSEMLAQEEVTREQLWSFLVEMLGSMLEDAKFTNYVMSYPLTSTMEELLDDTSVEINKSRKKLRLTFPDPVSLGLGDEGFQEIVLDKK